MILATHIIFVLVLIKVFNGNFLFVLPLALLSHYFLDVFCHWEYDLKSMENRYEREKRRFSKNILFGFEFLSDKDFMKDLFKVGSDFFFGWGIFVFVVHYFSDYNLTLSVFSAFLAVLPDLLQALFYTFKLKFLQIHQNFHNIFHSRCDEKTQRKLSLFVLQIALNVVFIIIFVKI
ncbi:hypothetical protein HRbin34_00277 [bacterium HR34]|nr:hypothetical protein HRbin34_00277 [bacterium HR34]